MGLDKHVRVRAGRRVRVSRSRQRRRGGCSKQGQGFTPEEPFAQAIQGNTERKQLASVFWTATGCFITSTPLKYFQTTGVWTRDFIPRGTRFGPVVGVLYDSDDSSPKSGRSDYVWKLFHDQKLVSIIDACDEARSNWMRFVNPACRKETQNLIACQVRLHGVRTAHDDNL